MCIISGGWWLDIQMKHRNILIIILLSDHYDLGGENSYGNNSKYEWEGVHIRKFALLPENHLIW